MKNNLSYLLKPCVLCKNSICQLLEPTLQIIISQIYSFYLGFSSFLTNSIFPPTTMLFPLRNSSIPSPCVHAKLLQSCLTLHNPMDCSPSASSVHGFLQARILEWIARLSSKGSSWPMDLIHTSYISCIGRQVLYQ